MNFKQLLSLFCDFSEKNTFISHEISFIVNYVDIEIWSDAVQLSFHQFSFSENVQHLAAIISDPVHANCIHSAH